MNLDEYVKQTLVQIVKGINDANKELIPNGAFVPSEDVEPWDKENTGGLQAYDEEDEPHLIRNVDFDIAIAVGNEKSKGGKAGLEVVSIQLGRHMESKATSSLVNRIKFSIPLALPFHKKKKEDNR